MLAYNNYNKKKNRNTENDKTVQYYNYNFQEYFSLFPFVLSNIITAYMTLITQCKSTEYIISFSNMFIMLILVMPTSIGIIRNL